MEEEREPLLNADAKEGNVNDKEDEDGDGEDTQIIKKARLVTVEPVVVVFMMVSLTTLPLLQQYMHERLYTQYNITDDTSNVTCGQAQAGTNDSSQQEAMEQANAELSVLNTSLIVLGLVPSLAVLIILGPYSDSAGRRKIILIPLLGALIGELIFMVTVAADLSLWLIPTGSFVMSMFGGAGCILTGCYAYVADITTQKQRMARLLAIEISNGVGVLLGQILIGQIITSLGFLWALVLEIIAYVLVLIYAFFWVPETIFSKTPPKLFTCANLTHSFKIYLRDDATKRRSILQLCLLILFFVIIIDTGTTSIVNFYLMDEPLCWGADFIGLYNGVLFMIRAFGSIGLTALLKNKVNDAVLMLIGFLSALLYFLLLAATTNDIIAFTGTLASFAFLILNPTVRSCASKLVAKEEQGALFGGMGLVLMLAGIVGSSIFNVLYAAFTSYTHGLVWIVGAAIILLPIIIVGVLWFQLRSRRRRLEQEYVKVVQDGLNDGVDELSNTGSVNMSDNPQPGTL